MTNDLINRDQPLPRGKALVFPIPRFVPTASYACVKISLDIVRTPEVISQQTPITAQKESDMTLTYKGLSRNGRAAFYTGAASVIRFSLAVFPNKTAPESIEVADGVFAAGKQPKVKLTKEERAALPKPTLAERIAKREAALARDKAKLQASGQLSM